MIFGNSVLALSGQVAVSFRLLFLKRIRLVASPEKNALVRMHVPVTAFGVSRRWEIAE